MAALGSRDEKNNPTICGGALISRNAVLTSVGCVAGRKAITVVLGATNLTRTANEPNKQTIPCSFKNDVIIHPEYDSFWMKPNLAIIKLPTRANITQDVQVIKLPTNDIDDYNTKYATVFGWGQTSEENRSIDMQTLRYTGNHILTSKGCKQGKNSLLNPFVDDSYICMSGVNDRGVCKGDGGSPLVLATQKLLIGVLPFDNRICGAGYAIPFTRISKYLRWIHENMH